MDKLEKVESDGAESKIYHNGTTAYKIYTNLNKSEKERRNGVLNRLTEIEIKQINNVLWPNDKIVVNKKGIIKDISKKELVGNTMEYIESTMPFDKKCLNMDLDTYVELSIEISKTLKIIHSFGVLLPDFNFSNVLIDKNLTYYFSDLDSASVDGRMDVISSHILFYLRKKGILIPDKASEDYDRIALILSFTDLLLEGNALSIKEYNYCEKMEQISALRDIKELVFELRNNNEVMKNVPYLHEIVTLSKKNNKT